MLVTVLFFAGSTSAFAQRNRFEIQPTPMKLDTNVARWHSIRVAPKANMPEIHFYNKINPVWWLQNADEPVPPAWYLPDDKHRATKWRFRNPFHNFTHYIIGVADKNFVRYGQYPKRNSDPNGGWNFALSRRMVALLPFVSYERRWITFYLGWLDRGCFGMEMRLHHQTNPKVTENKPDKPVK